MNERPIHEYQSAEEIAAKEKQFWIEHDTELLHISAVLQPEVMKAKKLEIYNDDVPEHKQITNNSLKKWITEGYARDFKQALAHLAYEHPDILEDFEHHKNELVETLVQEVEEIHKMAA